MAEVIPAFRIDSGSVYSEPAYRFNPGPGSVCSEPVYRDPSPGRCRDCRQSISRTPSQNSLPSLNGIVALAGMEPYASLRHPDGASDPNIKKSLENCDADEKIEVHIKENPLAEICETDMIDKKTSLLMQSKPPPHLPLLPISTPEAYDSGHDSTPRASKHSGISRRAESGYHSVATVRDSDESSFSSAASRHRQKNQEVKVEKLTSGGKKKNRQDKSLCQWLRNPFTCTYPETEGEVSDF
jgi:kinesin family member 26